MSINTQNISQILSIAQDATVGKFPNPVMLAVRVAELAEQSYSSVLGMDTYKRLTIIGREYFQGCGEWT